MPTRDSNFSRYVIPSPLSPSGECCICVPVPDSVQYKAMFLGALWRMSLQTNYERDDAHSAIVAAARWREVYFEVVDNMTCCDDTPITNLTQIEIRNTNIKILMQTIRQLYIDASLDVSVAYFQVPDDYDADAGDTGDEITDRERALCLACRAFVDDLFNQGMAWLEGAVPDVLAIATGSLVLPLVPTVVISVAGIGLLFAGANAYAELLYEPYRNYIACTMVANLQGELTSSRTAWNACLDTFPNPRPLPETFIQDLARDAIEEWSRSQINNLDNYLAFVSNLDAANSIAAGLDDVDCPCGDAWEHTFLGGQGLQDLNILVWPGETIIATYNSGDDRIESACWMVEEVGVAAYVELVFAATTITRVRMDMSYANTRATASDHIKLWDGVMDVGFMLVEHEPSPGGSPVELDTGTIARSMTRLELEVRVGTVDADCDTGFAYIRHLIINGVGVNPFL